MPVNSINDDALDFAYRYPFSEEAKSLISEDKSGLENKFLKAGAIRVSEDLNEKNVGVPRTSIKDVKYMFLLSYVYSRMIISSIGNQFYIKRYARGEALRAGRALGSDTLDNMLRLMKQLGIEMGFVNGSFTAEFSKFLELAPKNKSYALVHQQLENGIVYIEKDYAIALLETAIERAVMRNLPIRQNELPKEVSAYAKQVKLPAINIGLKPDKGTYRWIETVLATPIPDIRHRAVNLVLAPYLVNVKGLGEDDAASIILDYIERCKELNPETRVNSNYVKYQCRYAKAKGMRPLSFERARDLFRGVIDFG